MLQIVDSSVQAARGRVASTKVELQMFLSTKSGVNCREFSQKAYDLLQDMVYSVQYVRDPSSETGVYLRVMFSLEHKLPPLEITVPDAWIAWQISPT